MNEKLVRRGLALTKEPGSLYCQAGEMLDVYRVSNGEMVARLGRIFEAYRNGTSDLYMGRRATSGAITVDPADYVLTKRAVMEQWVDYHNGELDKLYPRKKGRRISFDEAFD